MPDSVGQVPLLVMFGRCPMGLCRQFVLLGCSSVCLMHTVISRANRQFEVCTGTPNRSTPVFTARRRQPMTSHGRDENPQTGRKNDSHRSAFPRAGASGVEGGTSRKRTAAVIA